MYKLLKTSLLVAALMLTSVVSLAAEVVDINRASAEAMIENWKGIGEVKARAIVAYRKKNGPFADVSELANVKGIGEGLLKKNRKYMSVRGGLSSPSSKSAKRKNGSKKSTGNADTKSANVAAKSSTKKQSSSKKKSSKAKSSSKSTKKKDKKKKSSSKKKPTT